MFKLFYDKKIIFSNNKMLRTLALLGSLSSAHAMTPQDPTQPNTTPTLREVVLTFNLNVYT